MRCNDIRMNYDENVLVKKREPYSTLASFRTNPDIGVLFGMYYQMDILETSMLYRQNLPTQYGYPTMNETLDRYPMLRRKGDDQLYVKIRKDLGIQLRYEKRMDWLDNFKPATTNTVSDDSE